MDHSVGGTITKHIDAAPPTYDIRRLHRVQERHSKTRQDVLNAIMGKIHHQIDTVAGRNETRCIYQIPVYLLGMPLYNVQQCSKYVIQCLQREGFAVQYVHPHTLVIDWALLSSAPASATPASAPTRAALAAPVQQMPVPAQPHPLMLPHPRPDPDPHPLPRPLPLPLMYKSTGRLFQ